MADPIKNREGPVKGAIQEIISAISALNMPPEPKEAPEGSSGYLSEVDEMAAHAVEHLLQALEYLKHYALKKIDQEEELTSILSEFLDQNDLKKRVGISRVH